jgi:signal transduction histidine kinase
VQLMEGRARLMRGVTHDLKNPLNAIDGHAQLLEDEVVGPLTDKQRASIHRIRRSVRSLLRLIEDLLKLYRVEAGQLVLHISLIDLRPVIAEAVEEHEAAANHAGHLIEVVTADGLPTVRADVERVRQVLGNLLSNAVKHTPAGGRITVRASRRKLRREGDTVDAVTIDVIDAGPGIPADKHEEIFAEFSRLAPARRPGSGLGLAIARRIARLLGGEITVASEPGRGSCFTFWVPADD